ncbi:MAG TPA: hypothetical protein VEW72_04935, partial [Burkholderiales bacterium]|nr:hypothetical protein [Burkholderiales bacterium]
DWGDYTPGANRAALTGQTLNRKGAKAQRGRKEKRRKMWGKLSDSAHNFDASGRHKENQLTDIFLLALFSFALPLRLGAFAVRG